MTRFDRTYDVSNNSNRRNNPVSRPKDRPDHLVYDEVKGTWIDPNPDEHHVSAEMDITTEAEVAQEAELTEEPAVVTPEPVVEPEVVTEDDTATVEVAEETQAAELAETPEVAAEDPVEGSVDWDRTDNAVGGNTDSV
jgi:hypothetical protein